MSGGISAGTMMAASAGMQVVGGLMQGQQASSAAEYNAAVAQQNATAARQQGDLAVEALQRKQTMQLGAMKANYGASGVTMEGSPTDVLAQSASMAALDRLTLKYNYDLKALGYQNTAALDEAQASNARTSSILSAIGTGIKGYGTYSYMTGGAGTASGGGTAMPWAGYDEAPAYFKNVS